MQSSFVVEQGLSRVIGVGGERLANCSPKGCGSEPVASAELYTP